MADENDSGSMNISSGTLYVAADFVAGDKTVNITAGMGVADFERGIDKIVVAIADLKATLRRERDVVVLEGNGQQVRVMPNALMALSAVGRGMAEPLRRETVFLMQFVFGERFTQWARDYLPLRGTLHNEPPSPFDPKIRLKQRGDQSISAAGLPIPDLRAALMEHNKTRLIILGAPGAGKTTTLHRFAFDLAVERMRNPLTGKIPFFVNLFEFNSAEHSPEDFLSKKWANHAPSESFGDAVGRGQVCFLLDGVNQMPHADLSARIEKWAAWARGLYDPNWAVFTCRSAEYDGALYLPEVHVQELDPAQMKKYFELKFQERAAPLWDAFEKRLQRGNDRFDKLAQNPYMLSLLAERAGEGEKFTDSRAALFQSISEKALENELKEERAPAALTRDKNTTRPALLRALEHLGYAMQQKGEGSSLTYAQAAQVSLPAPVTLDDLLEVGTNAQILECDGEKPNTIISFHHQLLQEFFAARELAQKFAQQENLTDKWRVNSRAWQFWRELFLMSEPFRRVDAVLQRFDFWHERIRIPEELPPPPVTHWEQVAQLAASMTGAESTRFIETVKRDNLPLAARALAEADATRKELAPLAERVRAELLTRMRDDSVWMPSRIDAGLALGDLGHPEFVSQQFSFEGKSISAIVPPMENVRAGEFVFGSDPKDKRAYPDEYTTQRRQALPAYAIGRYPVTNAEFKLFVEQDGYKNERWWSEGGKKWKAGGADAHAGAIDDWMYTRSLLQKQNLAEYRQRYERTASWQRYWQEVTQLPDDVARERAAKVFERPFDRPAFWNDPDSNNAAQPVVGVNWYEAEAYCAWLSAVTGRVFQLPSEMEWEKAARGENGNEYPWGETFESARANTNESRILKPTPVGMFRNGLSPFGLYDASGDVWEWTDSWYQVYEGGETSSNIPHEKYRVVRGGSFNNDGTNSRCAYRTRKSPVYMFDFIGFRVLSPGLYS